MIYVDRQLALDRPYTFVVVAILVLIMGAMAIIPFSPLATPVDIFPNINIPVVSIVWSYTGFSPQDMEGHIVSITERALTTTVNDIEHTASSAGTAVAGTTPAAGGGTELSQVAQTNILRVYVTVPEQYSVEVVPGVKASINLASNPNESVPGTLVRTSKSIDPSSLTLLAEIDVDNSSGKLFPGGYAQVHFDLNDPHPPLLIPGNALIFRAQGTQVGVVDGIGADDQVIVNPSDSITDGQQVKVKKQDEPPAAGSSRS